VEWFVLGRALPERPPRRTADAAHSLQPRSRSQPARSPRDARRRRARPAGRRCSHSRDRIVARHESVAFAAPVDRGPADARDESRRLRGGTRNRGAARRKRRKRDLDARVGERLRRGAPARIVLYARRPRPLRCRPGGRQHREVQERGRALHAGGDVCGEPRTTRSPRGRPLSRTRRGDRRRPKPDTRSRAGDRRRGAVPRAGGVGSRPSRSLPLPRRDRCRSRRSRE